jgi:hypothetical protein
MSDSEASDTFFAFSFVAAYYNSPPLTQFVWFELATDNEYLIALTLGMDPHLLT